MNLSVRASATSLSEKIAGELGLAEAEKDTGLLPVNCLLGELEELLARESLAEPLANGLKLARRWVDEIFDTTMTFSAPGLSRFRLWAQWWAGAFTTFADGGSPAPFSENVPTKPPEATAAALTIPLTEPTVNQAEPVLRLNLPDDRELLAEFVNEALEHLQNIEKGVLDLESSPADTKTLDSIFRSFHTFKGGSGFLNLVAIQNLAHELESLLDLARQHKLAITPAIINLILEGQDKLRKFTAEIGTRLSGAQAGVPIVVPARELMAKIKLAIFAAQNPVISESGEASRHNLQTALTEFISRETDLATDTECEKITTTSVKVDTLKLDALVELVGEMIITQAQVAESQDLSELAGAQLHQNLAKLGRISKDLRRTAMSMRMVPIRATLQKMKRVVRDTAAKVGKEVELVTQGEETEFDRNIVEEINDPLVHMIRNSIDHGIEEPEVRRQRGKPARGTIFVRAFHQGANIVIELKDDGNGLSRERILAKAIEKGLIQPGETPGDREIFNLIMEPGFSTAEKITGISGRGVGMDVVKRNIEKLRGKIEIYSTPGQGSTFVIFLPLTLAIIDGLLVGVGDQRLIVPSLCVREFFRPKPDMLSTVQGQGEMVCVRGKMRPLLRLYEPLGLKPRITNPAESIIMVVQAGNAVRCVMVDQLLGKQEIVIKSLGESFRRSRFVSGAAILGDGRAGLILDSHSLVHPEAQTMEVAA